MVSMRIRGREVLVHINHLHALAAVDDVSGGVDDAKPKIQLACPVHGHDPPEGANPFGGGDKADGPQLEGGQLWPLQGLYGLPLLAERTCTLGFLMLIWMRVGSKPFAHFPTYRKQAPPVVGLLQLVRAAREGLKVGMGVGGWVGKATIR